MSEHHCVGCGQALVFFGQGEPPARCEECVPETGPESAFLSQVATNLRNLRLEVGIGKPELARRAGMYEQDVSSCEQGQHEPGVIRALKFVHSLDSSIDRLTKRTYWHRGEVALTPGARPAPSERLSGFYSTLPANVAVFESDALNGSVASRREATEIFGRNVRAIRGRRHLNQVSLARAAGLTKSGLSLIERGARETTTKTLISLARSLEVTPEFLLAGIVSEPPSPLRGLPSGGGVRRHEAEGLDAEIATLWNEERTAAEIANATGISSPAVSAIVHRLREQGQPLAYRRPVTRAADRIARRRRERHIAQHRGPCDGSDAAGGVEETLHPDPASPEAVKARFGANIALYRHEAGITFRQLADATETDAGYLNRIEKGRQDVQLSLLVRLAGSLNVRCGLLTSGIAWEPTSAAFRIEEVYARTPAPLRRLGQNALRARRRIGASQEAVGRRAGMHRCDVGDFERGDRNFRIFALVLVAGSLGITVTELFSETVDWYVRPLPEPEYAPGETRPTKSERDLALVRLWREGKTEREIAEQLDTTQGNVASSIAELRNAGEDLPYRRPPLSAAQIAARRRRRDTCATQVSTRLPASGQTCPRRPPKPSPAEASPPGRPASTVAPIPSTRPHTAP